MLRSDLALEPARRFILVIDRLHGTVGVCIPSRDQLLDGRGYGAVIAIASTTANRVHEKRCVPIRVVRVRTVAVVHLSRAR